MRDYLAELGFEPFHKASLLPHGRIGPSREVTCVHCGLLVKQTGDVMRGHRRRCPVYRADPYTPGVCNS